MPEKPITQYYAWNDLLTRIETMIAAFAESEGSLEGEVQEHMEYMCDHIADHKFTEGELEDMEIQDEENAHG